MKAILGSVMFLLVAISTVFGCVADYWPNGADEFDSIPSGDNCSSPSTILVWKRVHWAVKYPNQPS
jgi:hypothetical protein